MERKKYPQVSHVNYLFFQITSSWNLMLFRSVVKGVKLTGANFGDFSLADLERLKNDNRWLSNAHVTLALQCVVYFPNVINKIIR